MAESSTPITLGNRKLVVLGLPYDVDTAGLRQYMSKYGELADVIVMKDRSTGRSRGFGYVTFQTPEDAEKAMSTQHVLNGRMLEVKVATPKENMQPPPMKKSSRIFVARIPLSVTEDVFKSYFEKYGAITDCYMPKDQETRSHRGIGFVTFESADSVDKIMVETHELGGSTIAVDRATPKDETGKNGEKYLPAYGIFNNYLNAARLGYFGVPPFLPFDLAGAGSGFPNDMVSTGGVPASFGGWQQPSRGSSSLPSSKEVVGLGGARSYDTPVGPPGSKPLGRKIFIGRIPIEATADDVRLYFSNFGRLLDVYLPKDKSKATHRGFGFVTFADDSSAERVAGRPHVLLGQTLALDHASPIDGAPAAGALYGSGSAAGSGSVGVGGPIRGPPASSYGDLHGGYDYGSMWGAYSAALGGSDHRSSHIEPRYRPY